MSSKGGCLTTSSPNLSAPRADQDPLNYDDRETISEILELISCSDSCHSEAILSEILPEVRTIEGSSRLFSAHNKLYPLPLDSKEFLRLDKQHKAIRLGMWGLPAVKILIDNALARDPDVTKAVLDIGCGSGEWACDMANEYDNLRVDAIDLMSQITSHIPPNVRFRIHNVNKGLEPYYGQYDVVHMRCVGSGIESYRRLLVEASKCLKPGGVAIFMEGDFDLWAENRETLQVPASDENPNGSWLQRWMQAVRMAQVKRCNITDSDDCPETLDKGLWQFGCYDPNASGAGCIYMPISPWVESDVPEEQLHYRVTGVLMRQNLKMFVESTEQLLVETGMTREQTTEWKLKIRDELRDMDIKMWKRWRLTWGRMPIERAKHSSSPSQGSRPRLIGSSARQAAKHELIAKVQHFHLKQCMQFNTQDQALQNVKRLNEFPYSTRGRF